MSDISFEEVVRSWILHYDDRLPNKQKDRIEAFLILLGNLDDYGYKKDSLTNKKRELIFGYCLNENHKIPKKLATWRELVKRAFEGAVVTYYGDVPIRTEGIITTEIREKLDNIDNKYLELKETQEKDSNLENKEIELTADMYPEYEVPKVTWSDDIFKKLEEDYE